MTLISRGDSAVSVPKATVSLNGTIVHFSGTVGEYTIDEACTGTIHFFDALDLTLDFVASPRGNEIWMIQTNPMNTVFQGTATRTLRAHDQEGQ